MANLDNAVIDPIPPNWRVVELGTLGLRIHGGGTPSTKKPAYWGGHIPWTTSAYIDSQLHLIRCAGYITEEGLRNSSSQLVPKGNLLVGTRVGVGKVAVNSMDTAISQDLTAIIVDNSQTYADFFAYAVMSDPIQEQILSASRGTTIKGIPRADLVRISILLPPLPEQRRIAAVLNAIQDAIAAQEDVIAAARQFKRSLMQRLFTYGPGREPAPTKETEIGEIPAHWEVVTIGDVSEISSGTTPSRANQAYWLGGTVPWVKTGEVDYCYIHATVEHVTPLALQETSLRLYPNGTLLLAMYGQGVTRGKVAVLGIEAAINQACAAINITTSDVQQGYLYHYLVSSYERLRSFSHGTQQLNLNARLIRDFGVPLPPASEQPQISASLSAADAKIAAEEDRKTALDALFKSMLHQLMTGQIRLLADEGLPPVI